MCVDPARRAAARERESAGECNGAVIFRCGLVWAVQPPRVLCCVCGVHARRVTPRRVDLHLDAEKHAALTNSKQLSREPRN
eukprot:5004824-Prymnesium_polylepis.1